jgi:hypothetical protein
MPLFRTLPVIVAAILFTPDLSHPKDNLPDGVDYGGTTDKPGDHHWTVSTPAGRVRVQPGDYVITGAQGERYTCKPDVFAAAYEETYDPQEALKTCGEHIAQFFAYAHLPPHLQAVSKPFAELAARIVKTLPRNPERTVALRKLLEAKDAAVRALVAKA